MLSHDGMVKSITNPFFAPTFDPECVPSKQLHDANQMPTARTFPCCEITNTPPQALPTPFSVVPSFFFDSVLFSLADSNPPLQLPQSPILVYDNHCPSHTGTLIDLVCIHAWPRFALAAAIG